MKIVRAEFQDLDDMCQTLRAWDVEFHPLGEIPSKETVGNLIQVIDGDIKYGYSRFTPGLSMAGTPPEGLVTFNVMEPANRRYWVRGHDVDEGMVWVFPVGAELRSVSAPGFQVHTLSVAEEQIERVADELEISLPAPSGRSEVFPIPGRILSEVRLYLRELGQGPVKSLLQSTYEILRLLVPCWLGVNTDGIARGRLIRGRDVAVRKGLELIESRNFDHITMDELVHECSVSERTLQYAFRERFGVSPKKFIKSIRLAKVRSALSSADADADTVGNIASQLGFWHFGRFASEYRTAFGELPSETLRKSHGSK